MKKEGKVGSVLVDSHAGRLFGLEDRLLCSFKLAADMSRSAIREFVNYANGPAFLDKKLTRFGVDRY